MHPNSVPSRFVRAGVLLAALGLAASIAVPAARAASWTWANAAGGNWSVATNWSPAGVPGAGDAVTLPALAAAYTVMLDANPSLGSLSVGAGATLLLGAGDSLSYAGRTLANDGTIVIGPGVANSLFLRDSTFLVGGGTLQLSGQGRIECPIARPQTQLALVNGVGHTLAGNGDIWVPVVNRGLLSQVGGLLTLWEKLYNYGTVSVRGGGHVNVDTPFMQNLGGTIVGANGTFSCMMPYPGGANYGPIDNLAGGTFQADGGDLTIYAGVIAGGTVVQTGGKGVVNLVDVGNPNNIVIAPGGELSFSGMGGWTLDSGVLENHGILHVLGALILNSNAPSDTIDGSGGGTLSLEGGTLQVNGGHVYRNAVGSTVTGCGTIACPFVNDGTYSVDCVTGYDEIAGKTFTNRGTLTVARGVLHVYGTSTRLVNAGTLSGGQGWIEIDQGVTVNNTGGTLVAGAAGITLGGDAATTKIVGGTLGSTGGNAVVSANLVTLQDVTVLPGTRLITVERATTSAVGTSFAMGGTNEVRQGGAFVLGSATAYVQNGGTTQLAGGTLAVPAGYTVNGALAGTGTIVGNVVNAGDVTPDVNATGLGVQGDYRQTAAGRLHVAIAGYGPSQFAHLTVTGNAQLDGAVTVTATNGFVPAVGTNFGGVVGAGTRNGQFAQVTPQGGLGFAPLYGSTGVSLVTTQALAVDGPALPASLRLDARGAGWALALPAAATVDVRAYDVAGREVALLASGSLAAGTHRLALARSLPSGLYFARAVVTSAGVRSEKRAQALLLH